MNHNTRENMLNGHNIPPHISEAASWWAKAIYQPTFDNGDPSPRGDIASLLAGMLNANAPVTQEEAENFKVALTELLMRIAGNLRYFELNVDYHPDKILYDAAVMAGISSKNCFPWKTQMQIEEDQISVSAGYGAPYKIIWRKTT